MPANYTLSETFGEEKVINQIQQIVFFFFNRHNSQGSLNKFEERIRRDLDGIQMRNRNLEWLHRRIGSGIGSGIGLKLKSFKRKTQS